MVNFVQRDNKRRKKYLKTYKKRINLKKDILSRESSEETRYKAQIYLQKLSRNSLKIRLRNSCALTCRSGGLTGPFKLSRIQLRELTSRGQIPGFKKGVW